MIQMWGLGTWALLQTVEAYGREARQQCLAVSGSQLVSGSYSIFIRLRLEVRVWDLATLDLQHKLPQPKGAGVRALLAVEGGVWAGVGCDLVVWGRGLS